MPISKQIKFSLAVGLQVVIMLVIVIFKLLILSGGTEIILQIEPVDPRDYLRGDYVTFRYKEVSSVNSYYADNTIYDGDTVYVILRQNGKYWNTMDITKIKPKEEENKIFLKGIVTSGGMNKNMDKNMDAKNRSSNWDRKINIKYSNIEEYFILEGKGQNFSFRGKDAAAKIVVDDNGSAVLKGIYIDNKLWP